MTNYNYETQRQTLIDYLQLMVSRADWHGVSDAANDLRVLEAENRNPDLAQVGEVGMWTADDTAYRPGGLPQSETSICCQDFDNCNRSCTPRGQWLAQKEAQREWQGLTEPREIKIEFKEWMHPYMGLVPVDPKTPLILKAVIREDV